MLIPSLISLAIACLAIYLSVIVTEEIVKITARGTAMFCIFLSLVLAPWMVLLILTVPVLSYKLAT